MDALTAVHAGRGRLELRGLTHDFPGPAGPVTVLAQVDLTVAAGSFVTLVGASGSGKSTLLALVAGLLTPTRGEVLLDGRPTGGPGPDRGLVLQTGALYPWRTVEQNIAFGLEVVGVRRHERRARVDWYLRELGLDALRASLPRQLSGGQKQRVAIARALACEPGVLLLDEPFAALDVQTKEDMQVFLRQIWRDTGTTIVMVTHDVEESVFLADRVVVLASDPGRVVADLTVTLAPVRTLAVKRTAPFLELRAKVEDLVRGEHGRRTA